MHGQNENPISIAFSVERNSGMDRGDLADLTAFVAVADHLSFRAAASQLGVTPSALSHSMRQLEERLGVRLLHRTTRSVSLTDAGRRLLDQLRPAINQIAGALENLNQERRRPKGRLSPCDHDGATGFVGSALLLKLFRMAHNREILLSPLASTRSWSPPSRN